MIPNRKNNEPELKISRRNLPHWEQADSTYFITFSTIPGFILDDNAKNIVYRCLSFYNGVKYRLYVSVIMETHVHTILQPFPILTTPEIKEHIEECPVEKYYSLSQIIHSVKSYSAHKINQFLNRSGSIWLNERYDRIIRDKTDFFEKIRYIIENPVKAGIVEESEDYQWLYVASL
jgi:putative transposase